MGLLQNSLNLFSTLKVENIKYPLEDYIIELYNYI